MKISKRDVKDSKISGVINARAKELYRFSFKFDSQ